MLQRVRRWRKWKGYDYYKLPLTLGFAGTSIEFSINFLNSVENRSYGGTLQTADQKNKEHSYIVIIIQIPYLYYVVVNNIQEISQCSRPHEGR